MANLSVSGIARLTRDPDVKVTGTGTWYSFGICSYRKNNKEGKQEVDFFDVDLFQKIPPKDLEQRLKKGTLIYIENGQLKNDQYMLDGKERSKVRIYISSFDILSGAPSVATPEPPRYKEEPKAEGKKDATKNSSQEKPKEQEVQSVGSNIPDFPDDPPF